MHQTKFVLKTISLILLSILSGVLLWLSWPVLNTTVLIFIAFVPLLYAADFVKTKATFFYLSFLTTVIWNIGTTWWVVNSTGFGVIAFVLNGLLMSMPLLGYYVFRKKYGIVPGGIALVVFWMSFEYIHLNWQLSWPWLTLGNVFAGQPDYVLWYRFTGVSGGTLWVLISNLLIKHIFTECVDDGKENNLFSRKLIAFVIIIVMPVFISLLITKEKDVDTKDCKQVVIVQPNIDPYQKFDANTFHQQMDILLKLSEKNTDSNTALILWPETAFSQPVDQHELSSSIYYQNVFAFINKHPKLTLQSGIDCYKIYNHNATATARIISNGQYIDAFNSAVAIQSGHSNNFYNKSKLVPGVESLPSWFKFMAPLLEQFGGSTGGYGKDSVSKYFEIDSTGLRTAPIICYESVYSDYVATYVARGANLLTIMTNDGWWGNTPGYKQHLQYARLRAIENNCYVIRSANTGISAVIDNRGNVLQSLGWDKQDVIKANIPVRHFEKTFYTLHGDYLYFFSSIIAGLFLLFHVIALFIHKKA